MILPVSAGQKPESDSEQCSVKVLAISEKPRFQLVSLLDMLKFYGEKFFQVSLQLIMAEKMVEEEEMSDDDSFRTVLLAVVNQILPDLRDTGLDVAVLFAEELRELLLNSSSVTSEDIKLKISFVRNVVHRQLSLTMLLSLSKRESEYYNEPRKKWEEVIARFPDTVSDIEEMSRCFALSRYAASVFHSVQIVEVGLIEIGKHLNVNDPLSGWTAVSNALNNLIKKSYKERTDFEKRHSQFFEQVQGTVEGLKNAWRNKISHAQGKLRLLTADFHPDIAEEIILATRAFMRRLATEMPERDTAET
ncbi:MAG TPA: hypothetical protein VLR90_04605 [Blastocatellia bacterium]|nr:hypothetical protein [Blastocatellia bacterium]